MASNEVRIIGGKWKGRKLKFPGGPGVRPSLGRVRETLFNWLNREVPGADCLDLYAGSGALGLEALSRGAASVVLVDRNRRVSAALKRNVRALEAGNAQVVNAPALGFLARAAGQWRLIFLDPPFAAGKDDELTRALSIIRERQLLEPGGLIYFEIPAKRATAFAGWQTIRCGQAGDSRFGLLASV